MLIRGILVTQLFLSTAFAGIGISSTRHHSHQAPPVNIKHIGETSNPYEDEVEALSEAIDSYSNQRCPQALLIHRGNLFLLSHKYDLAIKDFKLVALNACCKIPSNSPEVASALWGTFLAHAFSDDYEKSFISLFAIRDTFLNGNCHCKEDNFSCAIQKTESLHWKFIAEFADPNEKLTPEQCKQRVKATALAMKALCLKIPDTKIRFAAEITIDELAAAAYSCCEREHWTECLSPIVDAWKYLKDSMDKGVKYAPYVLFPSSSPPSNINKKHKSPSYV